MKSTSKLDFYFITVSDALLREWKNMVPSCNYNCMTKAGLISSEWTKTEDAQTWGKWRAELQKRQRSGMPPPPPPSLISLISLAN